MSNCKISIVSPDGKEIRSVEENLRLDIHYREYQPPSIRVAGYAPIYTPLEIIQMYPNRPTKGYLGIIDDRKITLIPLNS